MHLWPVCSRLCCADAWLTIGNVQVVGGMLVHLVRKDAARHCSSKFAKLSHLCSSLYASTAVSVSGQAYGVDPFLNSRSTMFDPDVVDRIGDFYNATTGSPEINTQGFPHAHFQRPVPGYPAGYPVVFTVRIMLNHMEYCGHRGLSGCCTVLSSHLECAHAQLLRRDGWRCVVHTHACSGNHGKLCHLP